MDGERRREKIVAFIEAFIAEHGHSPTVREIAGGVGLVSPGNTHRHLERLVDEGRLHKRAVTSRSFVYTPSRGE